MSASASAMAEAETLLERILQTQRSALERHQRARAAFASERADAAFADFVALLNAEAALAAGAEIDPGPPAGAEGRRLREPVGLISARWLGGSLTRRTARTEFDQWVAGLLADSAVWRTDAGRTFRQGVVAQLRLPGAPT